MKAFKPYIEKQAMRVREKDGRRKIKCLVRNAWYVVTEEELVRQGVLAYLIEEAQVPVENIMVEEHVRHWQIDGYKRMDIVITYTETTENGEEIHRPLAIIECKKQDIPLENSIEMILPYRSLLKAPYLFVTNGDETHCIQILTEENLKSLPKYKTMLRQQS